MTGRVQVYAVDDLAKEEGWREKTERAARDGCVSCGGGRIVGHGGASLVQIACGRIKLQVAHQASGPHQAPSELGKTVHQGQMIKPPCRWVTKKDASKL